MIEENAELYEEQARELGKDYGAELVTNKKLAAGLMVLLRKRMMLTGGEAPPSLRPSNYPTEEFIPICLSFKIPSVQSIADKWYFFRRSRIYALGDAKRAD